MELLELVGSLKIIGRIFAAKEEDNIFIFEELFEESFNMCDRIQSEIENDGIASALHRLSLGPRGMPTMHDFEMIATSVASVWHHANLLETEIKDCMMLSARAIDRQREGLEVFTEESEEEAGDDHDSIANSGSDGGDEDDEGAASNKRPRAPSPNKFVRGSGSQKKSRRRGSYSSTTPSTAPASGRKGGGSAQESAAKTPVYTTITYEDCM